MDELIVVSSLYDHPARVRSYELLAEAWGLVGPAVPVSAASSQA